MGPLRLLRTAAVTGGVGCGLYLGLVTGAATLDLGLGRRTRPLGPFEARISAPRQVVYDVATAPYAVRRPRALREKVEIWQRAEGMVLAAHRTPVRGRLTATTVETVSFEAPKRIEFRLVRGPAPHVHETFTLTEDGTGETLLRYDGELGTDLWGLGRRWGDLVAGAWEKAVREAFDRIKDEAERRG